MDKFLFDLVAEEVPKMNPLLLDNIAAKHLEEAEAYIDRVWESAARSFPPGLKYEGGKRCSPDEEIREVTRKKYNKQEFDLARNDVFMMKYTLSFNGEKLKPVYIYLPFTTGPGLITLRGSTFIVNPVLADRVFSVDKGNVFIPLTRDKLTFERLTHTFMANGSREFTPVIWSAVYHSRKAEREAFFQAGPYRVRMFTTLAHYLFAKYGVSQTFEKFLGFKAVFGEADINEIDYPPDQWIICQSTGMKPITVNDRSRSYQGPALRVAIPKGKDTLAAKSIVNALFYLADHFPNRVLAEYIDSTRLWQILLGHIIFKNNANEGKLVEDIQPHLNSLDGYIDAMVQDNLMLENIHCADIYDLFMHIVENMPDMLVKTNVSDMYSKRLTTLRYVLLDIVKGIFNFTFSFASKHPDEITERVVRTARERNLKVGEIFKINSGHGEVTSASNAGDNMFIKLGSKMVPQTEATGGSNGRKGQIQDPSKVLDVSLTEVGSYNNQPKFAPTGQAKINPRNKVKVNGAVESDDKFTELLEKVNAMIART